MSRKDVAASSLKILYEDFTSVKGYGNLENKSEYFCIKSIGKIQVGLTSFGQFIFHVYYIHIKIIRRQVWANNEDPDQTAP